MEGGLINPIALIRTGAAKGVTSQSLGRFGLRALRSAASTVSIVELLRSDWPGGIGAGLAWLVFLQVERRLPRRARRSSPAHLFPANSLMMG